MSCVHIAPTAFSNAHITLAAQCDFACLTFKAIESSAEESTGRIEYTKSTISAEGEWAAYVDGMTRATLPVHTNSWRNRNAPDEALNKGYQEP